MTVLHQQIIACAKENGYKESKYIKHNVVRHVIQTELIHEKFLDMGEWCIRSGMGDWIVTDEDFKQWQRDYKLKQLDIN